MPGSGQHGHRRGWEKYTSASFPAAREGQAPLYRAANENEQSRLVVAQVEDLHGQGVPLHQMAVLFRAAFHSFDLEIELVRRRIPFMKFGGFKFMESAHVKDLISYLRVVANPRDTLSWNRILQLAPGVGKSTANKFTAGIKEGFTIDAAVAALGKQRQSGLKDLGEALAEINSPSQTLMSRLNLALSHYEPLMKNRSNDYPKRTRDLEHLMTITARYREIRSFLNDLSLDPTRQHGGHQRPHPRLPHPVHRPLRQGPGMGHGFRHLGHGGPIPRLLLHGKPGRRRGGTPPHVCRPHPGQTPAEYSFPPPGV